MRQRRAILVGFAVALFLGVAVYFRLWAIDRQDDSTATADDREALRSATVSLAFALFLVAFPLSLAFPLLSHFNLIGNTQYIIFFFVHHRRQFERANMEAMDESAEWRMKYDGEVERNKQVQDELEKVHLPRHHYQVPLRGLTYCKRYQLQHAASSSLSTTLCILLKFMSLFQETMNLQKQIESLKQQIEDKRRHCNCSRSSSQL
ncbi:hypothetical protein GW17_00040828 [Ensete ventricosum]|nr:hypothetical protein GW17_00040828 [Ensete ventricosum]